MCDDCPPSVEIATVPAFYTDATPDPTAVAYNWKGWGPNALTIDANGVAWIADTEYPSSQNRLIRLTPGSDTGQVLVLDHYLVSVLDIAATPQGLVVLSVDGQSRPSLAYVNTDGELLSRQFLAAGDYGLGSGLTGIGFVRGEVFVELREGLATAKVSRPAGTPTSEWGYRFEDGAYAFQYLEALPPGKQRIRILTPDGSTELTSAGSFSNVQLIGVNPDGSAVFAIDETTPSTFRAHRWVYWFDRDATVLALAEAPMAEQAVSIGHPLALGPEGWVYGLLSRDAELAVIRLNFQAPSRLLVSNPARPESRPDDSRPGSSPARASAARQLE